MKRAAVAALVALTLVGCGGDGDGGEPLRWRADPQLISASGRDRVLIGEVTNGSGDRVVVEANDLRLLDGDGRTVPGGKRFVSSFIKSNYPQNRGRLKLPRKERLRIGLLADIEPGSSVPLTASWRQPGRGRAVTRIDTGQGSLPVPQSPPSG